jgi:hypothetical protein
MKGFSIFDFRFSISSPRGQSGDSSIAIFNGGEVAEKAHPAIPLIKNRRTAPDHPAKIENRPHAWAGNRKKNYHAH